MALWDRPQRMHDKSPSNKTPVTEGSEDKLTEAADIATGCLKKCTHASNDEEIFIYKHTYEWNGI